MPTPEQKREYMRKWHAAHPDYRAQYRKRYKAANPQTEAGKLAARERAKEYYWTNKEMCLTKNREWRRNNRAKIVAASRVWKAGAGKELYAAAVKRANAARYAKNTAMLNSLKNKPCADCGISYLPCVMDFDHIGKKEFSIVYWKMRSRDRLRAEIAKCEVVCANCHRIRTWTRLQAKKGKVA